MGADNKEATESFYWLRSQRNYFWGVKKNSDVLKQTPFLPYLNLGIFLQSTE